MTGVEFRNRSPYRARAMGRTGQAWSPVQLVPYAWYDAHAGGTSSTIADKSGNGRADVTFGATTAAPLYLPYTGTAYVHLEAASAGTNSISCTAPANTASYSAAPLGGGAPTTGVASPGAFAFTTDGDWESIALLSAGAVELATFRASDSTQTGVTDTYGVAWTINRGTDGRKTTILSPAANSTRGVVLFDGTSDYATVPSAAIPSMAVGAAWTVILVAREFATAVTADRQFDTRSASGGPGFLFFHTDASDSIRARLHDNSTSATTAAVSYTAGTRYVAAATCSTGGTLSLSVNGGTAATANAGALGSRTGGNGILGAAAPTPTAFTALGFTALLTLDRVVSAGELAQVVGFYGGGL